jgi:hypothetical protein
MQIIQSFLGTKIHPLAMRKSLCNLHNLIWRKQANPRRISSIKSIKTQLPLATSSKILLPRKHKSLINSLLSWDTTDNQHEDNEFTTFDSIPKQNNKHNSEKIKHHIPSILQAHIETNDISPSLDTTDSQHEDNEFTNFDLIAEANKKHSENKKDNVPSILQTHIETNDISPKKIKNDIKKTSKQTNKSEIKPKSKTEKLVKASKNNNFESKDSLLTVDEILDEAKHKKEDTLIESELNSKDNTIDESAFVENTPISRISTSHSIEDKYNLFRNINDEVQISSEELSSLPNIDPSKTFNIPDVSKIAAKPQEDIKNELPEIREVIASKNLSAILPEINKVTASDNSTTRLPEISKVTASDNSSAILPKLESVLPEITKVTAAKESVRLKSNKSEVITSNLGVTSSEDSELILPKSAENQRELAEGKSPKNSEITAPNSIIKLSKDSELITPKSIENQITKSLETKPITIPQILQQLTSETQVVKANILPIAQPQTNQENTPNSAFTSNVAETSNLSKKIIENKQIVEPEIPSTIANSEFLTTVNTSNVSENVSSAEVEQNTPLENLLAPKGYASGGHVTSYIENNQQIAPSDTVPAMLTPGEFVINARDTQKNIDLLQHINSGGTTENTIFPIETPSPTPEQTNTGDISTKVDSFSDSSLQRKNSDSPSSSASNSLTYSLGLEALKQENTIFPVQTPSPTPEQTNTGNISTKVDSFSDSSLQRKNSDNPSSPAPNFLTSSSLGLEVQKQRLSLVSSPQLNNLENNTTSVDESSVNYSSPKLIFRKANSTIPSKNTPSQWSSVEELLNGSNNEFTVVNLSNQESKRDNSELPEESTQIFAKQFTSRKGFAEGGKITKSDISTEIQPVTETVQMPSNVEDDDAANLEALAYEIYMRLRQKLEIERERQGIYVGRLPW